MAKNKYQQYKRINFFGKKALCENTINHPDNLIKNKITILVAQI